MATSDPIEVLLAYEQIRQLASRYAIYMNHRQLDRLAGLFVPDVRVGRHATGREALAEDFAAQLRPLGRTILQINNHLIDLDDDDPTAATGIVGCRGEIELDGQWVIQVIEYHDRYSRIDGVWYFVRRKHLLWYGAPLGVSPIGLAPANWPASAVGDGDLPASLPSWQEWIASEPHD